MHIRYLTRDHNHDQTIQKYNSLDVLIYNPGAIWWASVEDTPMKRYQLMQRVNAEGLYGAVHACLPHLKRSEKGGRIVVVSPPIYSRFFRGKTAYAMTKVAMSVLTKGLAMDFERQGLREMSITSIWPAVVSFVPVLHPPWDGWDLGGTDTPDSPSSLPRRSNSLVRIRRLPETSAHQPSSPTPLSPCSRPLPPR